MKVGLKSSPVSEEDLIPFLASCSCPRGTTGFGDDEDSSSSEESSSNDSYVEAPLENAQVSDGCLSRFLKEVNHGSLARPCAFSGGRSSCSR